MHYSSLVFVLIFLIISTSCHHSIITSSDEMPYTVFNGIYHFEDDTKLYVQAKDSSLIIRTDSLNLLNFADNHIDERVLKCNAKALALVEATIANDRKKIAELFGEVSGNMEEHIDAYLEIYQEVLINKPSPISWEIVNTFMVDEVSNHGFESDGWRWTTYVKVYWENDTRIIRYNWQPKTYYIDEWGLDKPVPFRKKMVFYPRHPTRSRVTVYNPASQTTLFLREMSDHEKGQAITTRFIAYDIGLNQTVSVRFRKKAGDPMYLEIGALEAGMNKMATKVTDL